MLPESFITNGPFGIEWLRPYQLFGLQGLSQKSHSVFWSMLFNIGLYVGISVFKRPTALEHTQATLFVDIFKHDGEKERLFHVAGKSIPAGPEIHSEPLSWGRKKQRGPFCLCSEQSDQLG